MVAQMTGLFGEDKIQHDTTFHRLGKEVFGVFLERQSSTPYLYLTVHGTYRGDFGPASTRDHALSVSRELHTTL